MRTHNLMNTGVYAIRHTESGKQYIGSAVRFDARWRIHRHHLARNTHHNEHLQSAWNKYGGSAFEFVKLVVCTASDLLSYEQALIEGYGTLHRVNGYNAAPVAGSMLGYKHSDESKAKIKVHRATQVFSSETRALFSKIRIGKKMPDWFPEFTRQRKLGTKHTEATKALIGLKGIGRHFSISSREKKSKITAAQVSEIKSRYQSGGITQKDLAREYLLDPSTISLIVRGKRWCTSFPKEN